MSLPYFEQWGWQAHVLAVHPDFVQGVQDPLLCKTIPSQIPVTYTKAVPLQYTRRIGMESLGLRCLPFLLQAGDRLLRQQSFDLVYFSTAIFPVMSLGSRWLKRFGVPYVLDFQDLWLKDYYSQTKILPPGGHFKYGFAQLQAKFLEPQAVCKATHVISVSPAYVQTFRDRYPQVSPEQYTVLPFGAPETDFKLLSSLGLQQQIFDPQDGSRHWVYVGRGGQDMALALQSLFLAIQSDRRDYPERWQAVRLHFVGTSYAPGDRAVKTVEPIAQALGVADLVTEYPHRLPYFEALQILTESDAILLIGSSDPRYTASKLYSCVLARKPILAIFHTQSSVVNILHRCQAGQVVTFTDTTQPTDLQARIATQLDWLLSCSREFQPETNWSAFQPYTAWEMTRQQCQIFNQCL
jgi:hypothetical protein